MSVSNIFELGELFEQVQVRRIFPDGKTFVDCIAKEDLSVIRNRYESEKNNPGFDLAAFVHQHFVMPGAVSARYESDPDESLEDHLKKLWPVLTRKPQAPKNDSLIPLPHDYIVPGGRFREIYYWDSFFTMLGLQVSNRIGLIENMVDNFSYLIDHIGYVPNGNRRYFIGRSQPPFFACMVQLLSEEKGKDILVKYLPQLQKEHGFWMKGKDKLSGNPITVNRVARMDADSILNRYWDENDTPRPESYREDIELAAGQNDKGKMYRHVRA
ncbi:MAG TPA: trehalase family glycosidase, partial [Chitinophagaceae bacterium]|nr:trehalase family glycosidase [Chitinophagaceae bacterium]